MRLLVLALATTGCAANFAESFDTVDAGDVDAKLGCAHGVEREHVEYEMTLAGVTVGRFQIAVGSRGIVEGRDTVIVHSRAQLAGAGTLLGDVDWDLTTTIDIASGYAIEQTEIIAVEAPWRTGKHEATTKWSIGERHHNAHTAAGVLRGWFSAPGANDSVGVTLLDHSIPVTIRDAARELVGDKPAARYDGLLDGRRDFSVWISDDSARVPLRLRLASKIGAVEVNLVDYSVAGD